MNNGHGKHKKQSVMHNKLGYKKYELVPNEPPIIQNSMHKQ